MRLLVQTYLQRNKGKATNEIWHQHLVQRDSSSMYLPPSSSSTIFSRFAPTLLITTNLFDKLSILFLFCVTSSNDRKKTCFILNNAIVLKRFYVFSMHSGTLLSFLHHMYYKNCIYNLWYAIYTGLTHTYIFYNRMSTWYLIWIGKILRMIKVIFLTALKSLLKVDHIIQRAAEFYSTFFWLI